MNCFIYNGDFRSPWHLFDVDGGCGCVEPRSSLLHLKKDPIAARKCIQARLSSENNVFTCEFEALIRQNNNTVIIRTASAEKRPRQAEKLRGI